MPRKDYRAWAQTPEGRQARARYARARYARQRDEPRDPPPPQFDARPLARVIQQQWRQK